MIKGKILKSEKILIPSGIDCRERLGYRVRKATKYGTFDESVFVCDEDYELISEISDLAGYDYAERKCDIKAIHEKAKMLKYRADGVKHLISVMKEKYKNFDGDCDYESFIKDLEHQLGIFIREYDKVYSQYVYMNNDYRDYTTRRNKFREKALERKKV